MSGSYIIRTLCYAAVFEYPLRLGELYRRTIAPSPVSFPTFLSDISHLIKQGRVLQISTRTRSRVGEPQIFYTLPEFSTTISNRIKREKLSREKMKKTRRVGKWLKKFPGLDAVYVTGGLAVANTTETDDIDLMIIVRPRTLWLIRLYLTLIFDLLHIRRKPNQTRSLSDKYCLNLFLTSDHLSLPISKRSLYTAHEVNQAKSIWSNPGIHARFLIQNTWTARFLPHPPLPYSNFQLPLPQKKTPSFWKLLANCDKFAFRAQSRYMQKRKTIERVGRHSAYFHPRDTAALILGRYHTLENRHLK